MATQITPVFSSFSWENYPSRSTPLSAENLNKLNEALTQIDNRVVQSWNNTAAMIERANTVLGLAESYRSQADAWARGMKWEDGQETEVTPTDPQYHNNAKWYAVGDGTLIASNPLSAWKKAAEAASSAAAAAESEDTAKDEMNEAEAWARGTTHPNWTPEEAGDEVAVTSEAPQYQNNSLYFVTQASQWARGKKGTYDTTSHTWTWTDVADGDYGYHDNAYYWNLMSESHEDICEAWAKGTKDGIDVPSTDPQYQNNSKWFSKISEAWAVGKDGTSQLISVVTKSDTTTYEGTVTISADQFGTKTDGITGTYTFSYNATDEKWYLDSNEADLVQYGIAIAGTPIDGNTIVIQQVRSDFYRNNAYYYSQLGKSWAVGNTGLRDGESTNNALYWSNIALGYKNEAYTSKDAAQTAAVQAADSATDAAESETNAAESAQEASNSATSAETSANRAEAYSTIEIPHLHIDFDSMELIQEDEAYGISFELDVNCNLLYNVVDPGATVYVSGVETTYNGNVTLVSETFKTKVDNMPGRYTFTYDLTALKWTMGGNDVVLAQYGMTLDTTPTEGHNVIVVIVSTNVNS